MFISVLIASHNGADKLPDVLDSLVQAKAPDDGFEIVIVDNASTDDTQGVALSFATRLPVRVLEEPRPGKNIALNTGLGAVNGDLVVFTDDDVILPDDFLTKYREIAIRETTYSLFGGHIAALWPGEPDERILEELPLGLAYTITTGARERGTTEARLLYGPNFAVRRSVFDAGFSFDESIGPNGGNYVMGDETEFLMRAERRGFGAYFEPDIVVQHKVSAAQLGIPWIRRRAFIAGRTMLYLQMRARGELGDVSLVFGFPRWAIVKLASAEIRALPSKLRPARPGLYKAIWRSAFMRGYLIEYRRQKRAETRVAS